MLNLKISQKPHMVVFFLKMKFHILHQKQKFLVKLHSTKEESLINQSIIKMTLYSLQSTNYNKTSEIFREKQTFTLQQYNHHMTLSTLPYGFPSTQPLS